MQENYELVQKGFRVLVASASGYIGKLFRKFYRDNWWNEVLTTLYEQRDLPSYGDYSELVDSLDIANCIRLIDRKWNDVFRDNLSLNCRTWAKELMGVRNIVSHIGQQDLDQPMAERALDTMVLLCQEMDPDGAEEIREIYKEVRARAADSNAVQPVYVGVEQPLYASGRGTVTENSLLSQTDSDLVQKTTMTRKVTYGGKTVVYPVYRVRLDALYYNDQNDRIATWITRYESENGEGSLNSSELSVDIYNRIIENFIVESNPEAIVKTQKNISLVGQREPGVTLADGRIVDGNRRFTCLRRIQRTSIEPVYFETVIMDMDIREDRKQIKLLELAIQHGEEKKVDYDVIDYAIGTYRDIVQTNLLTVEEYAQSTNEAPAEVRKRIEIAGIITEFLAYLKLPEQYHVAREMQVYSIFQEMISPLRQLNDDEKQQLKLISFNNSLMRAIPDQRKFIRDIKNLVKSGSYQAYFDEQKKIGQDILEKYSAAEISGKSDLDKFAEENSQIAEELQLSMERALMRYRAQYLKDMPLETVSKCIDLLMDVDTRNFSKMDEEGKNNLKGQLDELLMLAGKFRKLL